MRKNDFPKHVAIVMDGNGRWAKERGLPRYEGHRAGTEAVRAAIEFAHENQLTALTLFALSIENHECRPPDEVQFLLSLLLESLRKNTSELHQKNIRVRVIGDRTQFNQELLYQIHETENQTKENTGLTLVLAINYSGRWDIVQTAKKIAEKILDGHLSIEKINENHFASELCLADLPEPDLFIRTSGELRISNFMLWQFAYTEFFFTTVYWPDFNAEIFQQALAAYAKRERRFGLTSEQVKLHA